MKGTEQNCRQRPAEAVRCVRREKEEAHASPRSLDSSNRDSETRSRLLGLAIPFLGDAIGAVSLSRSESGLGI